MVSALIAVSPVTVVHVELPPGFVPEDCPFAVAVDALATGFPLLVGDADTVGVCCAVDPDVSPELSPDVSPSVFMS